MAAKVYWIDGPWVGRLGIIPRPRGGDWVPDEVAEWRESGIDVVVSFLMPDEVAEFDLEGEGEASRAHDIRFISFPIPDQGVPGSIPAAVALIRGLEESLNEGESVVLHCRQSIGRSSTFAAAILVAAGEDARASFERISAARGCSVPETIEQEKWVIALAQQFSVHSSL